MEQRGGHSLSALDTLINTFTLDEAVDKVRSLSQDNLQLRESTAQLNLWLHTACDTINTLQERLEQERRRGQEKCQLTREAIHALQLTITHKEAKIVMLIRQIQETNKLLDTESAPGSSLSPNVATLQQQKNDLELRLEESRSQMDLLNAQLSERASVNSYHVRAHDASKKTLHDLQMENNALKADKEVSLRNQSQLHDRLKASELATSSLRSQLSTQPMEKQGNHRDVQTLREQVKSLMAELQEKDTAKSRITKLYEEADSKLEVAQKQLQQTRDEDDQLIQTLRTRAQELEESLNSAKSSSQAASIQHIGMQQRYAQICSDYHKLLKQFEAHKSESSQSRQSHLELQERVDNLTAQLMSAEEAINTRDRLLRDLRSEQVQWKTDRSEIQLHQTQAEVYKQDFLAEKEARTRAEVDIDKMKEENKQLKEKVAWFSNRSQHNDQSWRPDRQSELSSSSSYAPSFLRQASAMNSQSSHPKEGGQPLSYPLDMPQYPPYNYQPPPADSWLRDARPPDAPSMPQSSPQLETRQNLLPGNTGPVQGSQFQYNFNHIPSKIPQERSSSPPPDGLSVCPGCHKRFEDLKILTEHVQICLNLDTT